MEKTKAWSRNQLALNSCSRIKNDIVNPISLLGCVNTSLFLNLMVVATTSMHCVSCLVLKRWFALNRLPFDCSKNKPKGFLMSDVSANLLATPFGEELHFCNAAQLWFATWSVAIFDRLLKISNVLSFLSLWADDTSCIAPISNWSLFLSICSKVFCTSNCVKMVSKWSDLVATATVVLLSHVSVNIWSPIGWETSTIAAQLCTDVDVRRWSNEPLGRHANFDLDSTKFFKPFKWANSCPNTKTTLRT